MKPRHSSSASEQKHNLQNSKLVQEPRNESQLRPERNHEVIEIMKWHNVFNYVLIIICLKQNGMKLPLNVSKDDELSQKGFISC